MTQQNAEQEYRHQISPPPIILLQGKARTKRPVPPHDMHMPDEDVFYERRKPTSARVYHHPRHAVRLTDQPVVVRVETKPKGGFSPLDWNVCVLIGMAAMFIAIVMGNLAITWFQSVRVDWQYGNPRTFQCDADVKHGGISHFIVDNLNGHIVVIEVLTHQLDKTKIYDGPVLLGKQATTGVATIRFEDINHDDLPDMLLTVENALYVYLNDGTMFHASKETVLVHQRGEEHA